MVGVPEWWAEPKPNVEPETQSKLLERRRAERAPDQSYDLDGDGLVCSREYFLAKRLDLNQDGKLDPEERRNAIMALKAGYEENFTWGVEQSGVQRGTRILQVRGKVVDAENFAPVADTYPVHPLTLYKSAVSTLTGLRQKRKQDLLYLRVMGTEIETRCGRRGRFGTGRIPAVRRSNSSTASSSWNPLSMCCGYRTAG